MIKTHATVSCDHPGCPAKVTAVTLSEALAAAHKAGWSEWGPTGGDFCPAHWEAA